jgi:hypothetical protein
VNCSGMEVSVDILLVFGDAGLLVGDLETPLMRLDLYNNASSTSPPLLKLTAATSNRQAPLFISASVCKPSMPGTQIHRCCFLDLATG